MFTEEERALLAQATRTMQVIVGALAAGIVSLLIVVLAISFGRAAPPPEMPMLTYMALALFPVAILVATLFPGVVLRSQRQGILNGSPKLEASATGFSTRIPAGGDIVAPYIGGYQTAVILRSAILEGAAFFALVVYLLDGLWWSLAAAAVLLLYILAGMPTRSRAEEAVKREQRAVEELRQMRAIDAR